MKKGLLLFFAIAALMIAGDASGQGFGALGVVPQARMALVSLTIGSPPHFVAPGAGDTLKVNLGYGIRESVIATDSDNDPISISAEFPFPNFSLHADSVAPGYSRYVFQWTPAPGDSGIFAITFSANDGHDNTVNLHAYVASTPTRLIAGRVYGIPDMEVSVPINFVNEGSSSYAAGFTVLIQFTGDIIHLSSVTRGDRVSQWQYFNVEHPDSGTVRIVGLARTFGYRPYMAPGDGPIAWLNFHVDPDPIWIGQYSNVDFLTIEDNDNTFSDTTGYVLIHPTLTNGWIYDMNPALIVIGDINFNQIPWEISDAVLFANHLIDITHYPFNLMQRRASDCNGDGYYETIPDLVYLINVINGYIVPRKISYGLETTAMVNLQPLNGQSETYSARYESEIPSGGILIRINHGRNSIDSPIISNDMTMLSNDIDGIMSVIIYDLGGKTISPNSELFRFSSGVPISNSDVTEIQISDIFGNFIPLGHKSESAIPNSFNLSGSYPNPFNSTAAIRFYLPSHSKVDLDIYNITGQVVRHYQEVLPAGESTILWDGNDSNGNAASSGVYFYRLDAGKYSASSKMTLLK